MKKAVQYLFLLGLPLLARAADQPTCYESHGYSDNESQTYCWVTCGVRDGKIAFVIFQTTHGTNTDYSQHIHLTVDSLNTKGCPNVCKGWIEMPDGTKRDLPSSKTVFEYTDGLFHSAQIDMSREEFSRHIDSVETQPVGVDPRGLTVDALKKFEKLLKMKSSNQSVEPTRALSGASGST